MPNAFCIENFMADQIEMRTDVSEIVEELIALTGWSEQGIAVRVGTNQSTVHRWKTGANLASCAHRDLLSKFVQQNRQKGGCPSSKTPEFFPQAEKMEELFTFLGGVSNDELGKRIGGISSDSVSDWRAGQVAMENWAKKLIAHELDVPEEWWDQPNVPLQSVIGKRRDMPILVEAELQASEITNSEDKVSLEEYRELLLHASGDPEMQAKLERVRANLKSQVTFYVEILLRERGMLPPQMTKVDIVHPGRLPEKTK